MELRQLETFVVVAEQGRCVAAAHQLSVSPATVTARLDRLEQSLGVPLLRRRTRHVGLTPAGARLLPEIRALVETAASLRERVERVGAGREGVLRVATSAGRRPTAVRVAGFLRQAVPGWDVQIAVVGRRAMLDVFRDDLVEVAVGRVRASRSQVHRVGIGARPGSGETIAWRRALPELPAAAIARIAEWLGAIVRRRNAPAPTQEMQRVAHVFAVVERLLLAAGFPDGSERAGVPGTGVARRGRSRQGLRPTRPSAWGRPRPGASARGGEAAGGNAEARWARGVWGGPRPGCDQ